MSKRVVNERSKARRLKRTSESESGVAADDLLQVLLLGMASDPRARIALIRSLEHRQKQLSSDARRELLEKVINLMPELAAAAEQQRVECEAEIEQRENELGGEAEMKEDDVVVKSPDTPDPGRTYASGEPSFCGEFLEQAAQYQGPRIVLGVRNSRVSNQAQTMEAKRLYGGNKSAFREATVASATLANGRLKQQVRRSMHECPPLSRSL